MDPPVVSVSHIGDWLERKEHKSKTVRRVGYQRWITILVNMCLSLILCNLDKTLVNTNYLNWAQQVTSSELCLVAKTTHPQYQILPTPIIGSDIFVSPKAKFKEEKNQFKEIIVSLQVSFLTKIWINVGQILISGPNTNSDVFLLQLVGNKNYK